MRVDDTTENASRCLCPGCPTYDDCMRSAEQRLFCSRGATHCTPKANGCICGRCPVWADNKLNDYYYCLNGPAQ